MSYLPSSGSFPLFSSLTSGLGSLSAYLGRRRQFDEEWAVETACREADIRYERDPETREKILTEVMESDPRRFGIFAKTYESIRPIRATGETKGYGEEKPKSSKGYIALVAGAGVGLALLGGAVLADMMQPSEPQPTPYIIVDEDRDTVVDLDNEFVIVDEDRDGLPDDLEIEWGYSTSEKDVRLKYWVQNPDENKALVDAALEKVVKAYKEENPLHINIHTYYGGEIPADVTYSNGKYFEFEKFTRSEKDRFDRFVIDEYNDPTGSVYLGNTEDVFTIRGMFLDQRVEGRAGEGALCGTLFDSYLRDYVGTLPLESIAGTTMHELGHNMCLDHTSNEGSIMNGGWEFIEEEWAFLKNERLFDFRPNEIVAKYVPK